MDKFYYSLKKYTTSMYVIQFFYTHPCTHTCTSHLKFWIYIYQYPIWCHLFVAVADKCGCCDAHWLCFLVYHLPFSCHQRLWSEFCKYSHFLRTQSLQTFVFYLKLQLKDIVIPRKTSFLPSFFFLLFFFFFDDPG